MDARHTEQINGDLQRVNFALADKPAVVAFLSRLQQWRGMFDALEVDAARRLQELSATAPADIAAATQRHNRAGDAVFERAATLTLVPCLEPALRCGALQGAHVDTIAKVIRTVADEHAGAFREVLPALITKATHDHVTPDELARALNRAARAIENDDGVRRHDQQRRETALRIWTDKRSGMFRISGAFDPLSGALLNGRLNAASAALFAERTPSTCPTNAGAKQDHLRALALLCLTSGVSAKPTEGHRLRDVTNDTSGTNEDSAADVAGDAPDTMGYDDGDEWSRFVHTSPSRFGRPEIVVVLDARAETVAKNDGKPVVDWGIPVELPPRALEELFPRSDAHPVIVLNGVVLYAPGEMDLGRSSRLASRAQRRALRSLYATCAVPGCAVKFDHCKPHHVHFWEDGGPTDLANLLPLCSIHHHRVHDCGWKLTLLPNRILTITYPDGAVQTTGPPRRLQAA